MLIGFDLSTKYIGAAVMYNDRLIRCEQTKLPGECFEDRLASAIALLGNYVEAYSTHRFAVEAPFVGRNGRTSMQLGKLCGVLHGIVGADWGQRVIEVTTSEVKKALTGTGTADKAAMMQAARAQFHLDEIGEHAADAIGVCLAAQMVLKRKELEVM